MKLLIDMNLSPDWVRFMATANIESAHWSTLGAANADDEEIMAYASANGYVILTHDLDFGAILAFTQRRKPSVIQIRTQDLYPSAIGKQLLSVLAEAAPELDSGALITVDSKRARLRLLPFPSK